MKELTELERNAIYLVRAIANSKGMNRNRLAFITVFGQDFHIETEAGNHVIKKFFGKLYCTI